MEEFRPLCEGEVKMYTCGPTVYDYAHIGNFRAFVFEDLLRRFLEFKGFKVKHVMNITDVDDKTIAGARREGKTLPVFTTHYTVEFDKDVETLNILPANIRPLATDHIEGDPLKFPKRILNFIQTLEDKGCAYESDGSVYYRVSRFPGYGRLSKKNLDKNMTGARVDVDEYDKEQGADFALWKKAKEGEPSWDSPWGPGRPGWHIECSAMSMEYLGETFDIHAGGEDLIFPHHENEIAQSEALTGKPFVRYWLHCKHLLVNGKKMSKSEGNFYTLRDLLAKGCDPMAVRYALISAPYRSPLNFTLEGLTAAKESLKRIRDFLADRVRSAPAGEPASGRKIAALVDRTEREFVGALENDLNSSQALAALFSFIKEVNQIPRDQVSTSERQRMENLFQRVDDVFGLFSKWLSSKETPRHIQNYVDERNAARKEKNFTKADELRERVKKSGFLLEDTPEGTRVKQLL